MTRHFTCSLCNTTLTEQPIHFVQSGKLWTVNVLVCRNEKCLVRRGATSVEYVTEKGANR